MLRTMTDTAALRSGLESTIRAIDPLDELEAEPRAKRVGVGHVRSIAYGDDCQSLLGL
jgi:hypothetical protein